MKEVVSLQIGQAGNQIGFALWELYLAEHGLSNEGHLLDSDTSNQCSFDTLFKLCHKGNYSPRALFIDMEPSVINQLKTGSFRRFFHPDQLINGSDDSGCNFARAYYTQGRLIYRSLTKELRRQIEDCDSIEAILIHRSLSGGSGSGLTSMCIEIMQEYTKITRIEIPIHPSTHFNNCIVGPYNSILGEHFSMDEIDVGLMIDNESLFDIVSTQLAIKCPTMTTINRIIAQVCSNMTASSRFQNQLFNDLSVIMTNLVPYPRIHFPLVSYAPFGSVSNTEHEALDILEITRAVFDKENQLINADLKLGRLMCCSMVYRGQINVHEVNTALTSMKISSNVSFVDWCPTGFKVGIVDQPPTIIPDSYLSASIDKNVIMMSNSSVVSCVWHRLAQRFSRLYSKRSFVHWFVSEHLEESEFSEALFNLASLAKDYEEVSLNSHFLKTIKTTSSSQGVISNDYKIDSDRVIETFDSDDSESYESTKYIEKGATNINQSHMNVKKINDDSICISPLTIGSVSSAQYSSSIIAKSPQLLRSVTRLSNMLQNSSFVPLLPHQKNDYSSRSDITIPNPRSQFGDLEKDNNSLLQQLIQQTSQQYSSQISF